MFGYRGDYILLAGAEDLDKLRLYEEEFQVFSRNVLIGKEEVKCLTHLSPPCPELPPLFAQLSVPIFI